MKISIPFSHVTIGQEEQEAVNRVLQSGWLAAGKETEAFEKEFSNYISPDSEHYYCIFTNSCTSALKLAYKWAKEQGYIHYVCPDNTFCATYSAAEEIGLKQLNIFIGKNVVSKVAEVNVHFGSVKDETPCLIEDSAHRIEPNDPLVGKIRCYSFYATKNMTTGSGGMLVTNDKEIYERCRLFWKDGLSSSTFDRQTGKSWNYTVETFAGGYDGNDIAAAIGRVQLRKLPAFSTRRREIRDRYNNAFGQQWEGTHLYPVFVKNEQQVKELIEYLKRKGIGCGYHYPNTGWLGVSLPIYPLLEDNDQDYIIRHCKDYLSTIR
jgi:perosamine synthetase